jgi:hypothetical protein
MGPYLLAESRGEADDVEVATEWILEGFVLGLPIFLQSETQRCARRERSATPCRG